MCPYVFGKVYYIFLDSLASLASLMMISTLTTRSKCEHKYRDNRALNKGKSPWNLKSYAFSYVNKYVNTINALVI